MPKRRGGSASPASASPKKSKVPPTTPSPKKAASVVVVPVSSPLTDNGNYEDAREIIMTDVGEDRIVVEEDTASTSSEEVLAQVVDQVSEDDDDEIMDTNDDAAKGQVKNGVVKDSSPKMHSITVIGKTKDWIGYLAAKQEFFEKLHLLNNSNDSAENTVKLIINGCKEVINSRFPKGDPADKDVKLDDDERRSIFEQSVREYLVENLINKSDCWERFLDLVIMMSREEICGYSFPVTILTDLVELSSQDECSMVFDFIETRLAIWKETAFYSSSKNAVLRMCNDMLRRQSRAQNTVFCGRILIFLSNYFPFSERSGLNVLSEFHLENVTSFKTGDISEDPEDQIEVIETDDDKLFEGMDISIPGLDKIVSLTQEEKKKKIKVDHNLYVKFWSLQDHFRNPNDCFKKIQWKTFTTYTEDVLGAFNSFKLDEASHRKRIERSDDNLPSINPIPKLGDENLYFAKYLTNRRLLELQMNDPSFRRYFLLQLVVILQYFTIPAKCKNDTEHVLADDQKEFVKNTTEKVYKLLSETPPNGPEFVKCVQHILKREELWNKWKNSGCPTFAKPTPSTGLASNSTNTSKGESDGKKIADGLVTPSVEEEKVKKKKKPKRPIGDSIKDAVEKNRVLIGHTELTRLWNICPDNLEACRLETRNFMPQIDVFFAEAFKEIETDPTALNALMDPKKEVKNRKILGDPMYGWNALRLLARRSPYFFQMFAGGPISPLQNYLEYVLKKIKAEKEPPQISEDSQTSTRSKADTKAAENDGQANQDGENAADGDQVVEAAPAEDDEILRPEENKEVSESGGEEEGEVTDKFVRPMTEEEQKGVSKGLGKSWLKLAAKLGYKSDEIQYFIDENKENPALLMLQNWQEQDDDNNAADLMYILEGMKLKELAAVVFKP